VKRPARHLGLAAAIALLAGLAAAAGEPADALDRVSLLTAWLCLALFAAALLIGPIHALRTGRVLTNHLLRRDLGIWCALTGLAHLGISFAISMTPAYMQIYVYGATSWPEPVLRRSLYSWAVIGSLVIAAVFAVLLLLSSNWSLRLMGAKWWKRLQRLSYLAFALTVAHSVAFQLIESRTLLLVIALALLTTAVVAAQLAGWSRVRRNPASDGWRQKRRAFLTTVTASTPGKGTAG
jgi:sulfoxide reductase heme-binding subunit YedZ